MYRHLKVTSLKEHQTVGDMFAVKEGRIGFRTPTIQEIAKDFSHWNAPYSPDWSRSSNAGYRKHPFILRQVAVCRFLKLVQREETADWIISQSYID